MLQALYPYLAWYVVFGAIWFYLIMNERLEKGELQLIFAEQNKARVSLFLVLLLLVTVVSWPISVYMHFTSGKIRDMFQ